MESSIVLPAGGGTRIVKFVRPYAELPEPLQTLSASMKEDRLDRVEMSVILESEHLQLGATSWGRLVVSLSTWLTGGLAPSDTCDNDNEWQHLITLEPLRFFVYGSVSRSPLRLKIEDLGIEPRREPILLELPEAIEKEWSNALQ